MNALGPDIIAIKDKICLSFECKAWEKNRLSIDHEAYEKLYEWERNTKFPTYIAWRMNGKGWFFIKLDELKHGEKDHSITKIKTLEINRIFDDVLIKNEQQPQREKTIEIVEQVQPQQAV